MSTKPVALVFGMASVAGKRMATRLVAEGYVVYSVRRPGHRAIDFADFIGAGGIELTADMSDGDSLTAAIDTIVLLHGRIDALIGGYGADCPQEEERCFRRWVRLCLPHMKTRGRGKIVGFSKGGWLRRLHSEVEPFGIRVEFGEIDLRH